MRCEWGCTALTDKTPAPAKEMAVITVTHGNDQTPTGTVYRVPVCGVHRLAVKQWMGQK